MSFRPNPDDELAINGVIHRVAEHPSAPGMPYGQEGRAGIVYRLYSSEGKSLALKIFKPRFRLPYVVSQADKLSAYSGVPGLQAAHRTIITPSHHTDLIRQHSDLTYAVLMPWIEGSTWLEIILNRKPFTSEYSLMLARSIVSVFVHMEERGLAHCDLSGPNVMLPALAGKEEDVALIDLEGFYAPDMIRPQAISNGSAGYAHQQSSEGVWGTESDRFSGAVLLAEMLSWCDPQVCQLAWSESYFDPKEMQMKGERYDALIASQRNYWGSDVSSLFERAWTSDSLSDCPTFGEWLVALPEYPLINKTVYDTVQESDNQLIPAPALHKYGDPITEPITYHKIQLSSSRSKTPSIAGSKTSELAALSFITGIASWILIPFIGGFIAIFAGHTALNRINESKGKISGKKLAFVGLFLGYINIAISILGFGIFFIYIFFLYLNQVGY